MGPRSSLAAALCAAGVTAGGLAGCGGATVDTGGVGAPAPATTLAGSTSTTPPVAATTSPLATTPTTTPASSPTPARAASPVATFSSKPARTPTPPSTGPIELQAVLLMTQASSGELTVDVSPEATRADLKPSAAARRGAALVAAASTGSAPETVRVGKRTKVGILRGRRALPTTLDDIAVVTQGAPHAVRLTWSARSTPPRTLRALLSHPPAQVVVDPRG